MPKSLFEHLSPDTGAKRILALDGGGVKGVLTLGLLKALEDELRRRAGGSGQFRLGDYFDLIGGASSGAVIATGLALGLTVDELIDVHMRLGAEVFGRGPHDGVFLQSRSDPAKLRRVLLSVFSSKTLGSQDLKTGLAILVKRIDTGAAWTVTNHPLSARYDPPNDSGVFPSKRYRLVDLVLASAGAPSPLDEVAIDVAFDDNRRPTEKGYFLDAALSANSNPSLQLFMLAVQPSYRFGWKPGADSLMMTSCGVGARRPALAGTTFQGLPPGLRGAHALRAMAYDTQMQGVMLMQALSEPKRPWETDAEIGDTRGVCISGAPLLDYQRIDVELDSKPKTKRGDPAPPMTAVERLLGREMDASTLEALDVATNGRKANLDLLLEIGLAAGRTFVDASYPDAKFDLAEWRP